jgi:hypothetical protein
LADVFEGLSMFNKFGATLVASALLAQAAFPAVAAADDAAAPAPVNNGAPVVKPATVPSGIGAPAEPVPPAPVAGIADHGPQAVEKAAEAVREAVDLARNRKEWLWFRYAFYFSMRKTLQEAIKANDYLHISGGPDGHLPLAIVVGAGDLAIWSAPALLLNKATSGAALTKRQSEYAAAFKAAKLEERAADKAIAQTGQSVRLINAYLAQNSGELEVLQPPEHARAAVLQKMAALAKINLVVRGKPGLVANALLKLRLLSRTTIALGTLPAVFYAFEQGYVIAVPAAQSQKYLETLDMEMSQLDQALTGNNIP